MAKFRFVMSRRSITDEQYWVEADSEEEAEQMLMDGEGGEPILEFVDWYDDQYTMDSKEPIEPLYEMLKSYTPVDILDV
jgi:hypothetical protein